MNKKEVKILKKQIIKGLENNYAEYKQINKDFNLIQKESIKFNFNPQNLCK